VFVGVFGGGGGGGGGGGSSRGRVWCCSCRFVWCVVVVLFLSLSCRVSCCSCCVFVCDMFLFL